MPPADAGHWHTMFAWLRTPTRLLHSSPVLSFVLEHITIHYCFKLPYTRTVTQICRQSTGKQANSLGAHKAARPNDLTHYTGVNPDYLFYSTKQAQLKIPTPCINSSNPLGIVIFSCNLIHYKRSDPLTSILNQTDLNLRISVCKNL